MVDGIPYELIPKSDPVQGSARGKRFHYLPDAESFAQKVFEQNLEVCSQWLPLLDSAPVQTGSQAQQSLAGQLFAGKIIARLGPNGGGLKASRPPTAQAKPKAPAAGDALQHNTLLSQSMRGYLRAAILETENRQGQLADTAKPVVLSSAGEGNDDSRGSGEKSASKDYQVVVEVAGRSLSAKQAIQLSTAGQPPQKKYSSNDHKSSYRSLCQFANLANEPVNLALTIPFKGRCQPLVLPLAENVRPTARGTDKSPWDNLLIPVRPLQFLNEQKQKTVADILQQGWLYVFWCGKLWRELAVNKHTALSDVDVSFYRNTQQNNRPAEGHWLDAVWVPYLLKGKPQTDITLAASPVQWTWSTIEHMESHPESLREKAATLDAFADYCESQQFTENALTSGALLNARASSDAGQRRVQRQRPQQISAAYLPKSAAKLSLQLLDQHGIPWSNADVIVELAGSRLQQKTDADGYVTLSVPHDCRQSQLDITVAADVPRQLVAAQLNQLESTATVAGLQARLNNLGFNAGPVDGIVGRKTRTATRRFQSHYQLTADGIAGPQTQQKLGQVHQS